MFKANPRQLRAASKGNVTALSCKVGIQKIYVVIRPSERYDKCIVHGLTQLSMQDPNAREGESHLTLYT